MPVALVIAITQFIRTHPFLTVIDRSSFVSITPLNYFNFVFGSLLFTYLGNIYQGGKMSKNWMLIAIVFIVSLVVFTAPLVNHQAAAQEWNWQNPLPQGNRLNGIWGSSTSNVFAVGEGGTIIRYNGTVGVV